MVLIFPVLSLNTFYQKDYQQFQTTADSGFDSDYSDYDSGSWDDDDSYYDYDDDDDDFPSLEVHSGDN